MTGPIGTRAIPHTNRPVSVDYQPEPPRDALLDFIITVVRGIPGADRRVAWLRWNLPRTSAWMSLPTEAEARETEAARKLRAVARDLDREALSDGIHLPDSDAVTLHGMKVVKEARRPAPTPSW